MTVATALLDSLFSPCHVRDGLRILPLPPDPQLEALRPLRPPAHLRDGHDIDHLISFAAHVKAIAEFPVQVVQLDSHRFTHILGRLVFARRPDGVFDLYFWRRHAASGRWTLQQEPDDLTPLLDLPRGSLWLDDLRKQLEAETRSRLGNTTLAGDWAVWAWWVIEQWVVRHIDRRRLQSRIRGALDLDLEILHTLRKRRRRSGGPPWFVIEYNRELRRREQTGILEREAPALLPLYQGLATHKDFDASLDPKQALQRLAAARGVKPRTWKWLAQSGRCGTVLFRTASREFFPWDETRNALEYLDVLATLAPSRRPSAETLRQVLSLFATRTDQPASYAIPMQAFTQSLRHIVRLLERPALVGESHRDPQTLHAVLAWLSDTNCRELTRSQRQGGWAWLMRRAEQYRISQQRKPAQKTSWNPAVTTIEAGPFRIVPLASAVAVWEEAIEMRHCADRYINACVSGSRRLFSIRGRGDKRLATVCLSRSGGSPWTLTAIRGKANSEPSAAVHAVVKDLLAAVNRPAL